MTYAAQKATVGHRPITICECDLDFCRLIYNTSTTNLLTYSEEFDNAAWTKSSATVTADDTTAPDGTTTADLIATSSSGGLIYQDTTITDANNFTFSIYLKEGTGAVTRLTLT